METFLKCCIIPKNYAQYCRYDLEVLYQCGNRVKTKFQNVLRANSYFWRSFMEEFGGGVGTEHHKCIAVGIEIGDKNFLKTFKSLA